MTERLLGSLLERRREDLLDAWTETILAEPLLDYKERPPELIRSWVSRTVDTMIISLYSGCIEPLQEYGRELGKERQRLGFHIDEVLDALLCGKQALVPIVIEELCGQPERIISVTIAFATKMRHVVCAFAGVFADTLGTQQKRVTTLEERQRVARDLHDSVTQSLYAANMYGGAVERLLAAGDTTTALSHLKELRTTTGQALREMRMLIFDLRASDVPVEGLAAALEDRLAAVEQRVGVKTEFLCPEPVSMSREQEEAMFGVAREALNNALKHARAQYVEIRLVRKDGRPYLSVSDDGVGFDMSDGFPGGGLGLRGMEERCRTIGAHLEISSAPDQGTTVAVRLIENQPQPPDGKGDGE